MAFPQVAAVAPTVIGTNTFPTHTINVPSASAGDLLLGFFTMDAGGGATATLPSGWTSTLYNEFTHADTNRSRAICFYRIADGEEPETIDITVSATEQSTAIIYRITGWHGTTPPEANIVIATDSSHDPPALTPSWGAEDTLWFAVLQHDNGFRTVGTWPANYGNEREETGGSSSGTGTATARRELNTSSENPGVMVLDASVSGVSATVAIRPGESGGGGEEPGDAFPQVATTSTNVTGSNSTSHTITLPSGIEAGDLLIAGTSMDGNPTITWNTSGWEPLFETTGPDNAVVVSVRYRIATGSDTNPSLTTSALESGCHFAYRITGHHPGAPPEVGTSATGTSVNPDPPSLSPSWGAEKTLWIAIEGSDSDASTVSAFPADYTDGLTTVETASTKFGAAQREREIDTENPGTFTIDASEQWVANTVAIRPAPGGGAPATITLDVDPGEIEIVGQNIETAITSNLVIPVRSPGFRGGFV